MNVEKLIKVIGVIVLPNPMLKSFGAIFLSLLVAFGLIIGVEGLSSILHPWPEGFSGTSAEINLHVQNYPSWVLAVFNMILLPYPSWFWFLNLTVLPAAAFCGTSWANKV